MLFQVVPFNAAQHDRSTFDSGSPALDTYLKRQVSQDIKRRVATCLVALTDDGRIAGYYTLAATSVLLDLLPEQVARKLPRYPSVPAILMGRLAVDQTFKGQKLGGALLADALARSANAEIAAYALIVDAKDEDAASFYGHHGFIALPTSSLRLFLPLASIRPLVE